MWGKVRKKKCINALGILHVGNDFGKNREIAKISMKVRVSAFNCLSILEPSMVCETP